MGKSPPQGSSKSLTPVPPLRAAFRWGKRTSSCRSAQYLRESSTRVSRNSCAKTSRNRCNRSASARRTSSAAVATSPTLSRSSSRLWNRSSHRSHSSITALHTALSLSFEMRKLQLYQRSSTYTESSKNDSAPPVWRRRRIFTILSSVDLAYQSSSPSSGGPRPSSDENRKFIGAGVSPRSSSKLSFTPKWKSSSASVGANDNSTQAGARSPRSLSGTNP
mmetsp:Transcript_125473/g.349222  ORF Transcript_125473/g.349222 Transcript_125473/m.349222 type:complete len:220 (+) Transcript_125473:513-1172(+)